MRIPTKPVLLVIYTILTYVTLKIGVLIAATIPSLVVQNEFLQQTVLNTTFRFPENSSSTTHVYFLIVNALLHVYALTQLWRARKIVLHISHFNAIYYDQSKEIKAVANGLLGFAKIHYILLMCFGVFFYMDIAIFIKALPAYLFVYVISKLLLLFSYVTQHAELLQQEQELTV